MCLVHPQRSVTLLWAQLTVCRGWQDKEDLSRASSERALRGTLLAESITSPQRSSQVSTVLPRAAACQWGCCPAAAHGQLPELALPQAVCPSPWPPADTEAAPSAGCGVSEDTTTSRCAAPAEEQHAGIRCRGQHKERELGRGERSP